MGLSILEQFDVQEYKDGRGEYRIRVKHINGNIEHASTEGYKNISECRRGSIRPSIVLIEHYKDTLSVEDKTELIQIVDQIKKEISNHE